MPEPNKTKRNTPRSLSLLKSPDVQQAAKEALHAPAKLPDTPAEIKAEELPVELLEPASPPAAEAEPVAPVTAEAESTPAKPERSASAKRKEKKGLKSTVEDEKATQNVAISGSLHQMAKLAATHFGQSLRDLVEEAVEAHPNVKKMKKLLNAVEV